MPTSPNNAAPDPTPCAAAPSPPQAWESDIIVPLTQNVGGGIAAAIILAVLNYAWTRANHLAFDQQETLIWTGLAGILVAAATTLIRFFSDELGLLRAAYIAGQRSMTEEIMRLNRQISILEQIGGQPTPADATTTNKRLGKIKGDLDNATMLLNVLLDGGDIVRDSDDHNLTQRPWERAVRLLEKAKIYIYVDRSLLIPGRSDAHKTLTEFYQQQYDKVAASVAYQPPWW